MTKQIFASLALCALLFSGNVPTVAAVGGTLTATVSSSSPSGDRPVSTTAELFKFTLRADGADVPVALIKLKVTGGLVADKLYFFVEDTNALIGSAAGTDTNLVFNGALVKQGKSMNLVVKADMRGPSTSPVSVEVTELVLAPGAVLSGIPLKGPAVRFGASATTVVPPAPIPEVAEPEPSIQTPEPVISTEDSGTTDPVTLEVNARETQLFVKTDTALVARLLGRILLQVQGSGEAWYVAPTDGEKYYLRDGSSAYQALRKFGLGIKNADLMKIPIGLESRFAEKDTDADGLSDKIEEALGTKLDDPDSDDDGFKDGEEVKSGNSPTGAGKIVSDPALAKRLAGKILLQVESKGEAWYVNPADNRRYYMTNGDAAYQIMRFLSLGITNVDLRKIPVGAE